MEEFDERESYLECLGNLIGLEVEPKSGLRLKKKDESEGALNKKDVVIPDLSTEKARTWKKGALTAAFQKYGYGPQTSGTRKPSDAQKPGNYKDLLHRFRYKDTPAEEGQGSKEPDLNSLLRKNIVSKSLPTASLGYSKSVAKRPKLDDVPGVVEPSVLRPFVNPVRKDRQGEQDVKKPTEPPTKIQGIRQSSSVGGLSNLPAVGKGLFSSISGGSGAKPNGLFKTLPSATIASNGNSKIESKTVVAEQVPDNEQDSGKPAGFKTAYEQLRINDRANGIKRNFTAPEKGPVLNKPPPPPPADSEPPKLSDNPEVNELMMNHESLKIFESAIIERILGEVMEPPQEIGWDDVAGLEGPKSIIKEIIIWPLLRPDIFKGLRAAPKGILLFGPPGTGKTMIGRLIATQSKSTFFSISASSLTSKWIGDGEKIVRALFLLARIKQPSVIFIDEIDSIMTQRSDTEHESSRRMKTEFLVQFDGCGTDSEDRVLVIGVTNRPHELDEAARRRLVKRIYIPLPDFHGRRQIVKKLMSDQSSDLNEDDYNKIAEITDGYSGADMKNLCHVAANEPIRDISDKLEFIDIEDVRPINLEDFLSAKEESSKTVAEKEMSLYEVFDDAFGCKLKAKKQV